MTADRHMSDWQKSQAAKCSCRGSDEMCPCQNIEQGTWFQEQRLEWARESLQIFGFLNREHMVLKFGISAPQAAKDFGEARKRWPTLFVYNASAKRYEKPQA